MKKIIPNILMNRNGTTKFGNKTKQRLAGMVAFDRMMRAVANDWTHTSNNKGKAGKLEYIWTGARDFKEGNKKWVFRKFEKKPFDNAEGFIKGLEKRGFKRIGSGAFSTVLAKEGQSRVIKVIRRPDGWINYVHWAAQAGEAGHFAPKVYSYKKIKGKRKEFAVAVMERLPQTLEDTPEDHVLKVLPNVMWRADNNEMAAKFVEVLAPGLMAYLKKMKEWKNIPISNFDFHDGNLMVRDDGTVVIVDPVSRGDEGYTRLREGDFRPLSPFGLLCPTEILINRNNMKEADDRKIPSLLNSKKLRSELRNVA